jgi:hypothetical protein
MADVIIIAKDPSLTVEAVKALKDAEVSYKLVSMKDKLSALFMDDEKEEKEETKEVPKEEKPVEKPAEKEDRGAKPEGEDKTDKTPKGDEDGVLDDLDSLAPKEVKEAFEVKLFGEPIKAVFGKQSVLFVNQYAISEGLNPFAVFELNDMQCKVFRNADGTVNLDVISESRSFRLSNVVIRQGRENVLVIKR